VVVRGGAMFRIVDPETGEVLEERDEAGVVTHQSDHSTRSLDCEHAVWRTATLVPGGHTVWICNDCAKVLYIHPALSVGVVDV
jgi:hypothetical protein